ncbi:hypothetical protein [Paraburkholderia bannensis]|uniref:hypothetical protein n=1 Tax=Paraburkholderia bannensis TaxID=765414 RepID=UPI0012EC114D|nr:hypothetical protein [Paraburkholderia bannensis]
MKIISEVSQLALERDAGKLKYIDILPGELLKFTVDKKSKFINFTVEKLHKFSKLTFRSEQEFSENDDLNSNIEDGREEVIGFPKNFLVIYMAEFFILCEKSDFLDSYLGYVRVSGAKKYAADLRKIFSSAG